MKITDISIELDSLQIKTLSKQEANVVVGGSKLTDAMSSLVEQEKMKKALLSAVKAQAIAKYKGVPGAGGTYDPSCPLW